MKVNFLSANLFNKQKNNNDNKNKVNFKGSDFYEPIKRLRGVKCAICNREVITSDMLTKARLAVAKPLSVVFEKGYFKSLEQDYPKAYALIQEFINKFPKQSLDEIVEESDNYIALKKAICENLPGDNQTDSEYNRKVKNVFFDVLNLGRAVLKNSSIVIKNFAKFKENLGKTRQEILEQFEIYSRKYPKKTLSEIVNTEEIYKFHTVKSLLQSAENREQRDYHFENIKLLITKKSPDSEELCDKLKAESLEIFSKEDDVKAREFKIKQMYLQALKELGCEKLAPKVIKELEAIKYDLYNKDKFFMKMHQIGASDGRILASLIGSAQSSEDHITALAKNGTDELGNKIIACRVCNGERSDKSYSEMIEYHPEIPQYVEEQIQYVSENINKGKLTDKLYWYPFLVTKKFSEETSGTVNVDLTKFCKDGIKKSKVRAQKLKEQLDNSKHLGKLSYSEIKQLEHDYQKELSLQATMQEYLDKKGQ
ncbi:MAG: HNH endonuclease [Cyanobacteria bacterium SIG28]|nr:HNH endonuclease [Cyanobacteria bacterium SIG28]